MHRNDRLGLYESLLDTFLARTREKGYVIFEVLGRPDEYVQFQFHGGRVYGEVGSRQWSEPERPLEAGAVEALGRLGFSGGGPECNHACDGLPARAHELAQLADTLFHTAYGVPDDFDPVVREMNLRDVTMPRARPFTRDMVEEHLRRQGVHFLRDQDGDFRLDFRDQEHPGVVTVWLAASGAGDTVPVPAESGPPPRRRRRPRRPEAEGVIERRDRYRGALLGLAAGDALGTTLEFQPPGSFTPIDGIVGGGPFRLRPGEWTDDTSMALCLAESLVECAGFDAADQMRRYVRWRRDGHLSSTGACFDIGSTVSAALHAFERTGEPFSGPTDPHSAGNGSLMRLAPIPLAYAASPVDAVQRAAQSSRTTHGAREAVDACRYCAALMVGALEGRSREELLSPRWSPVPGLWEREPLAPRIDAIAAGSFREKRPPQIRGSGYVVDSLEAALWALDGATGFRDACLRAVNLGDDADTTGAIAGQLAGALWGAGGETGIPQGWVEVLARRADIEALADRLLALSEGTPT